jgi:catechol 2,3-dioxygenase-like lactoylglutathione lyase family enzyme
MISYAVFGANDPKASIAFFEAVLAPLGYLKFYEDGWAGFAPEGNPVNPGTIWVGNPFDGKDARAANGAMIGLAAPTRAAVRDAHAAALINGGTSEGEPGIREAYGPDFYMAYMRDPCGNKFSVMCRSTEE